MKALRIVHYGHPALRERAAEIQSWGRPEREFLQALTLSLHAAGNGIGLAANQVAVLKRIFVVELGGRGPDGALRVFVNPEVVEESVEDEPYEEGCLSIPDLRAEVYRPARITVRARDENFETFSLKAEGLLARVIQHEIDHLNGKLFVDLLADKDREKIAGKLGRIRRETLAGIDSHGVAY
jgi:peptide deformylase